MDLKRLKILMTTLFIFTLCSLLLPLSTQASSRGIAVISDLSHKSGKLGTYRALIIGINDYKDTKIPDLETAVNDAKAMAELLRERYGFQVKLLLDRNATKEAIYRALRKLASSTKPDDSVLIYYAGHGDLDRTYDDGWWIPADAKSGNPITYLDNVQVQKSMRSMKARHVLLISDSCYSGTLFGQVRAMPQVIDDKYYLNLYNEKSRWGMTSGNNLPVSDRGTGGHSVFAYQLLKELRKNVKPYISTQELYTRIAPIVSNNSEQTPLCRPVRNTGDQGGEFVFVASSGATIDSEKDTGNVAQMVAERKQLEQERIELERLKIEIERKKLEAERSKLKKEKPMLAYIPKSVTEPRVILRSKKSLGVNFKKVRKEYNFYDPRWNKEGDFNNDYVDNGNGTITDRTTGLIWQKEGDAKLINLNKFESEFGAEKYIEKLNKQRFAGQSNWRMPTVEELASLIEPKKLNGNLHIDPFFSQTPICISADRFASSDHRAGWGSNSCFVDFERGMIINKSFDLGASNAREKIIKTVHFKAVCSIR